MRGAAVGFAQRCQQLCDELSDFDTRQLKDLDTLEDWPASVRGTVVVGAFVFVWVATSLLWLAPEVAAVLEARSAQGALQVDYLEKSRSLERLAALHTQVEQQERSLGVLLSQLPSKTQMPRLIEELTATGLASGVTFSRIQPAQETTQDGYRALPIEFEMSGSYHDFALFVSGVAQLERLLTVHDFDITRGDDEGLRMQMTARTYHDEVGGQFEFGVASEGARAAAGSGTLPDLPRVRYAAAGLRSPFVAGAGEDKHQSVSLLAPDVLRARAPLESFALSELRMVGFFAARDGLLALIETPEAELQRIGVGNYVGANHGRVWRVRRTGVDLIEIVPNGAGSWVERPQRIELQRATERSLPAATVQ